MLLRDSMTAMPAVHAAAAGMHGQRRNPNMRNPLCSFIRFIG